MRYVSVGCVAGLTRIAMGFKFDNGVAEVSEDQHKACGHVLQQDFAAYPEAMVAEVQAAWDTRFLKIEKTPEEAPPAQPEAPPAQPEATPEEKTPEEAPPAQPEEKKPEDAQRKPAGRGRGR